MNLTVYNEDSVKKFLDLFFESLNLIEGDSLGGHGSRGYGKVVFTDFKIFKKTAEDYKNHTDKQEYKDYQIPSNFIESLQKEEAS